MLTLLKKNYVFNLYIVLVAHYSIPSKKQIAFYDINLKTKLILAIN